MIAEATSTQTYQQMQPYLFTVAYRMTGSASDAEDLVQDAWIRYLDAGSPDVSSLRAWLTTAVSRLSLDYLKSARVKREEYSGPWLPEPVLTREAIASPEETVEQREAISMAFLTLLERLTPEQRVVYVLREALGLSYDEIARHVDKSAAACRQNFHRAQLRLTEETPVRAVPEPEHRELVDQFLVAFASGDAAHLATLLSEDVRWISDGGPDRLAARRPITGNDKVARFCAGLVSKVPPEMDLGFEVVDLNGAPALLLHDHGKVDRVFALDVRNGRIASVAMVCNLDKLRHLATSLGLDIGEPYEWKLLK